MECLLLLYRRLCKVLEAFMLAKVVQKLASLEGRGVIRLLAIVELSIIALVRVIEQFL